MRLILVTTTALAIAGCTKPPANLFETQPDSEYQSTAPAKATTDCIAANARKLQSGGIIGWQYEPFVRELAGGAYQVEYDASGMWVFIARVTPAAQGAGVRYWRSNAPVLVVGPGGGYTDEEAMRGCAERR